MDKEPESKEVMVESMSVENGTINMSLTGEPMKQFYAAFVRMFEETEAENYLTVAVEHQGRKFEVTVRDCTGGLTPAEKIEMLEKEIQELKENKHEQ